MIIQKFTIEISWRPVPAAIRLENIMPPAAIRLENTSRSAGCRNDKNTLRGAAFDPVGAITNLSTEYLLTAIETRQSCYICTHKHPHQPPKLILTTYPHHPSPLPTPTHSICHDHAIAIMWLWSDDHMIMRSLSCDHNHHMIKPSLSCGHDHVMRIMRSWSCDQGIMRSQSCNYDRTIKR